MIAPEKITCVGLNYRRHALEAGFPVPTTPVIFGKFANSLAGSGTQVVSNLTVNAVVHASARRVDLRLEDQGPAVVLKITNQGTPIPDDMLEAIFEPMVHHSRHISDELSGGLGLGLFIVREIVKAHGGTVQVSSPASEGTTFSVRLPRS